MTTTRYAFLTRPEPGGVYELGQRALRCLKVDTYNKVDGSSASGLVWSSDCANCGQPFEFKTGRTAGDLPARCWACRTAQRKTREADRKAAVRMEYEIRDPVSAVDAYRAVQAVQADTPRQMSIAPNASRRIYAPVILREAHAPLAEHSYGEILEGITEALRRRMIYWAPVGRYRSGHAVKGLLARSEATLRANGLWPEPPADFFA